MKEWFQRNKDWLITLAVFSSLAFMGFIWSMFFRDGQLEKHRIEERAVFTIPTEQRINEKDSEREGTLSEKAPFFLHPGPEEILAKLENMNFQELSKQAEELPGLRVMWPAYFFSINKMENNMAEVIFDANEDGFGALIQTSVDTTVYPEILNLSRGTKIWLAGEIQGIDPTGTGQFAISTEHIRFDDYAPPDLPK